MLDVGKITIGDNVLFGPNASLYTAGNPCRIIREITDADRPFYFKNRRFDDEVWKKISEK